MQASQASLLFRQRALAMASFIYSESMSPVTSPDKRRATRSASLLRLEPFSEDNNSTMAEKTVVIHINEYQYETLQVPGKTKFSELFPLLEDRTRTTLPECTRFICAFGHTSSTSSATGAATDLYVQENDADQPIESPRETDAHAPHSGKAKKLKFVKLKMAVSNSTYSKAADPLHLSLFPPISIIAKKTFGVPLESFSLRRSVKTIGMNLAVAAQASAAVPQAPSLVPGLLKACFEFLSKEEYIEEGLFRLSASSTKVDSYVRQLNSGLLSGDEPHHVLFPVPGTDSHLVANLVKLFLRELPDPLLTTLLIERWMSLFKTKDVAISDDDSEEVLAQKREKRANVLRLLAALPEANRQVLRELLRLINRLSYQYRDYTKMDTNAFAIVVGPCIMFIPDANAPNKDQAQRDNQMLSPRVAAEKMRRQEEIIGCSINCAEYLIRNFDDLFIPSGALASTETQQSTAVDVHSELSPGSPAQGQEVDEERVVELESRIKDLERQLTEIQEQNNENELLNKVLEETLQEQQEEAKKEADALRAKLKPLEDHVRQLEREKVKESDKAAATIKDKDKSIKTLKNDKNKLVDELNTVKQELEHAQQNYNQSNTIIENLRRRIGENELQGAKQRVEQLERMAQRMDSDVMEAQGLAEKWRMHVELADQKLEALQRELEKTQEELRLRTRQYLHYALLNWKMHMMIDFDVAELVDKAVEAGIDDEANLFSWVFDELERQKIITSPASPSHHHKCTFGEQW